MSEHAELDAFIASLNLEYSASFVPWRQSRNKDQKDPSLNWSITLKKGGAELTTDYMQGIGCVPGYRAGERAKLDVDRIEQAANSGKYFTTKYPAHFMKPLPEPTLRDVLYSLVSDSDVLESSGFEDWASNLGYDTDSRKAEAMYRDCIESALRFKALIGQENLDKLRELFQGY